MLFPLTVLWVSVTAPKAQIPPPEAKFPVVLLPLTVLWSSVRLPVVSERIAPPLKVVLKTYVVTGGPAAGERQPAEGEVARGRRDVEDPRKLVGVDRHVRGQRPGVDHERLADRQLRAAERDRRPGKRGGERDRVGAEVEVGQHDRLAEAQVADGEIAVDQVVGRIHDETLRREFHEFVLMGPDVDPPPAHARRTARPAGRTRPG